MRPDTLKKTMVVQTKYCKDKPNQIIAFEFEFEFKFEFKFEFEFELVRIHYLESASVVSDAFA